MNQAISPILIATALRTIGVSSLQSSVNFLLYVSFNNSSQLLSDLLLLNSCSRVQRAHQINCTHSTGEISLIIRQSEQHWDDLPCYFGITNHRTDLTDGNDSCLSNNSFIESLLIINNLFPLQPSILAIGLLGGVGWEASKQHSLIPQQEQIVLHHPPSLSTL